VTEKVLKPGLAVPIAIVVTSWVLPSVLLGAARKTRTGRVLTSAAAATAFSALQSLRSDPTRPSD
jgi:hypothetical protein